MAESGKWPSSACAFYDVTQPESQNPLHPSPGPGWVAANLLACFVLAGRCV